MVGVSWDEKKIFSEKYFFSKKKNFFEKLYNSAVMMVGFKFKTPNERPGRAILKSENRLILSILVFELFAI